MEVHIGREIEKVYRESGMKLSEFARRINTSSRNIYSIFERREVKTDQLQKIGEVLGFDFFSFYKNKASSIDPNAMIAEDLAAHYYRRTPLGLLVSIELDGSQATLDFHIRRISAINRLVLSEK